MRQRDALALRCAGNTYQQIADSLGYRSASGARAAIVKGLKAVVQEPALELRAIQVERLNDMLHALWPKVEAGDPRSIDAALKVMTRLDALMGTESVQRIKISAQHQDAIVIIDGSSEEYIKGLKRMIGLED